MMELRTVVATVESGEQDTVLRVLQIYNQEVSDHPAPVASVTAGRSLDWLCREQCVPPGCPRAVSAEPLCALPP